MMVSHLRRWRSVLLLLGIAALLCGCSGNLDNCIVEGKVTYNDKPVTGGQVVFASPSTGGGGSAALEPDGSFKVKGLMRAGTYKVTIAPPPAPPPLGPSPVQKETASYVPQKYRDEKTTPLEVKVESGKNNLDLKLQ